MAANYPNNQISYATTANLLAAGAPVIATSNSRNPLHVTVTTPFPLTAAQAAAISATFTQIPNPAKC